MAQLQSKEEIDNWLKNYYALDYIIDNDLTVSFLKGLHLSVHRITELSFTIRKITDPVNSVSCPMLCSMASFKPSIVLDFKKQAL